jgi:hypothetical protein
MIPPPGRGRPLLASGAAMASPIVRETIKKLKERRALLQKQVKGPLEELRQIDEDLAALGAAGGAGTTRRPRPAAATAPKAPRAPRAPRAPKGANQSAILRAVRNGATTPAEIAEKTGLAVASVTGSVTGYTTRQKLLVRGPNGLTLTKAGRDKLAELEARQRGSAASPTG